MGHRHKPKTFLGAYVGLETYEKIDEIRGQVPKSEIIYRALCQIIEREVATTTAATRQEKALGVADNNK
jgi:hypothetical protein